MGYVCYNKSKVNNYLEKKRINNLDETSFVYVKGNFEPIVSEALWHECERIRKSRIVNLRLPDGETRRKGIDSTKYLWVAKLRCRCGSSYRIFNWRKLKDGTPVFGYQCNMRTVNPTRSFVLEHNMTEQLSCDAISIPEWKLELMAKKIFEKVWGNQNKAILRACKMIESCQNGKAATRMSAAPIQSQIEKIKKRKLNYAAMRADGELPREEYQALCKQADDEIARLEQELKALSPAPEPQTVSSDLKAIYDFLSQKVDVHGARLALELIDQFVEVVTPFADYSYRWKLNTGCKKSKEKKSPPSRQNPSTFSPVLCSNSLLDCRVSSCAGLSGQQISVRSALFGASNSQQGLLSPQHSRPSRSSVRFSIRVSYRFSPCA